jgi:hypothetical protein
MCKKYVIRPLYDDEALDIFQPKYLGTASGCRTCHWHCHNSEYNNRDVNIDVYGKCETALTRFLILQLYCNRFYTSFEIY